MLDRRVYLGCDVREQELLVVAMSKRSKGWRLLQAKRIPLDDDVSFQIGGTEDGQMRMNIEQFQSGTRLKGQGVHLSVPTQYIFLRRLQHLPDVSPKELAQLLHFEIGQSIHLPFEDPFYDCVKLGSVQREETNSPADGGQNGQVKQTSDVLLVASSKSLLEKLVDSWEGAQVKVLSVDICGLALQRLISYLHPDWLSQTELVLDLRPSSADVHIYHQGILMLSRHIPLREEVVQEEGVEIDRQGEPVKGHEAVLESLIREIEQILTFFQYTLLRHEQPLVRLIVTGHYQPHWLAQLQETFAAPVEKINLKPLLRKGLEQDYINQYSVAIGLALRGKYRPYKLA